MLIKAEQHKTATLKLCRQHQGLDQTTLTASTCRYSPRSFWRRDFQIQICWLARNRHPYLWALDHVASLGWEISQKDSSVSNLPYEWYRVD